jgi:hypothetical protein
LSRPSTLAPTTILSGLRDGRPQPAAAGASERAAGLRSVAIGALSAMLVLAPFEGLIGTFGAAGLVVTDLEIAWTVSLVAWAAVLIRERRLPDVTVPIAVALIALGVVTFASALLAGPLSDSALRFAFRSAAFWAIFLASADLAATERLSARVVAMALAGATLAAGVAWLSYLQGTSVGLIGVGRDFTVAGQLRVSGPFDYPNTAAMAWEAVLLAALPLVLRAAPTWTRFLVGPALVLVGGALIVTFSRGALLGALAGLGVMTGLALLARRRQAAILASATGAALVGAMLLAQLGTNIPFARLTVEGDRDLYGAAYTAPSVVEVEPGAEVAVPVTVTNAGAAPWHAAGDDPFRVSYHWLDPRAGSIRVLDGERTPLPHAVGPGERITLDALVIAPSEAGVHVLAWDVVHEGVAWLSEKGVPAWAMSVRVGESSGTVSDPGLSGAVQVWPDLVPVPSRAELWAAAFEMIRSDPVLGVGPGVFRLIYGDVLGWERWDDRIHANDLYLEIAATTGLAGLVCFLVLVLAVMVRPLRDAARRVPSARAIGQADGWLVRVGLLAALVAFLAHGVVDYFLAFAPTGLLFWVFLGLLLGLRRTGRLEGTTRMATP